MATSTTTSHLNKSPSHQNVPLQPQKPLALEMVAATREMHTIINRLVVSRLPLALPPQASDAGPYISGLLHFLPVYTTFEKLWLDMICDDPPKETALDDGGKPQVPEHVHGILKELYIPQLFRSNHLRADIKTMTGWSDAILDRQMDEIKGRGQLCAFISHIKQTVSARPHTLIAYSYNLFMALFAGGRFIRASFEKAGNDFWETVPMSIKPAMQPCGPRSTAPSPLESTFDMTEKSLHAQAPLQFWRFDTAEDGEDLKRDYKERLLTWEDTLSRAERDDVVRESIIILENIELIVGQLDKIHSNEPEEKPNNGFQISKRPSLASRFVQTQFVARIRDSFLIAKERGVGSSFRNQSFASTSTENEELDFEDKDADHGNGAADVKLCPGIPKSMRFAKSLPIPPRHHVRVAAAKDDGALDTRSPKQLANATMPRPVLVGILGLFILCIFIRVRGMMSLGYTAMVQ